jgi:hypothetical protein
MAFTTAIFPLEIKRSYIESLKFLKNTTLIPGTILIIPGNQKFIDSFVKEKINDEECRIPTVFGCQIKASDLKNKEQDIIYIRKNIYLHNIYPRYCIGSNLSTIKCKNNNILISEKDIFSNHLIMLDDIKIKETYNNTFNAYFKYDRAYLVGEKLEYKIPNYKIINDKVIFDVDEDDNLILNTYKLCTIKPIIIPQHFFDKVRLIFKEDQENHYHGRICYD